MKPEFIPKTLGGKLNWLAEEAAELAAAIGKTQRFASERNVRLTTALHFYDPTIAHVLRETNHAWILRELADLKAAIALFDDTEISCLEGDANCSFLPHETFTCYRCEKLRCFCMGADGHKDCNDCWSKRQKPSRKKPHAKKQSQQAQPTRAKKPAAKKARIKPRVRAREHLAHYDRNHRH